VRAQIALPPSALVVIAFYFNALRVEGVLLTPCKKGNFVRIGLAITENVLVKTVSEVDKFYRNRSRYDTRPPPDEPQVDSISPSLRPSRSQATFIGCSRGRSGEVENADAEQRWLTVQHTDSCEVSLTVIYGQMGAATGDSRGRAFPVLFHCRDS